MGDLPKLVIDLTEKSENRKSEDDKEKNFTSIRENLQKTMGDLPKLVIDLTEKSENRKSEDDEKKNFTTIRELLQKTNQGNGSISEESEMDFCDDADSRVENNYTVSQSSIKNNILNEEEQIESAIQWKTPKYSLFEKPLERSGGSSVSSEVEYEQGRASLRNMAKSPENFYNSINIAIKKMCKNPVLHETWLHLNKQFSELDLEHARYMLILKFEDPDEFHATASRMCVSEVYPTLLNPVQIKLLLLEKYEFLNSYFSPLSIRVPFKGDPLETICDSTRKVSERYIRHARAQLSQDFPVLNTLIIKMQLEKRNFLYYETLKDLWRIEEVMRASRGIPYIRRVCSHKAYSRNESKGIQFEFPNIPDIDFYMEYAFARQREAYIAHAKVERALLMHRTPAEASEIEYPMCVFCGEHGVLIKRPLLCVTRKHIMCHFCAIRIVLKIIQDKTKPVLMCGEKDCESFFSVDSLMQVVPKEEWPKWMDLMLAEQNNYHQMSSDYICPSCITYRLANANPESACEYCYNMNQLIKSQR